MRPHRRYGLIRLDRRALDLDSHLLLALASDQLECHIIIIK
jgi:hypothetical protein